MTEVEEVIPDTFFQPTVSPVPPPPPNVGNVGSQTAIVPAAATGGAVTQKKVTYYIATRKSRNRRLVIFVMSIVAFGILLTIMILCVVYLAPQTPYNLGPMLCCSPANMFPGQRLQNKSYSLKLDTIGTLTLYKEADDGSIMSLWSTDTADLDVASAFLNTNGTLQLINKNRAPVWTTPPPPVEVDFVIPVAPYSLQLSGDGTTTINSANGVVVWEMPASSSF